MIRRVYNNKLTTQPRQRTPQQEELLLKTRQSKKIYIPVYLNKFRIVGCLDSGSDVTIMQESLFNQIFKKSMEINQSEVTHIVTFSDDTVNVLGEKTAYVKLEANHPGILMSICIIKDIPNVPSLLLGSDLLELGLGSISYNGDPHNPTPQVTFRAPTYVKCKTFFEASRDIYTCTGTMILEPFEMKEVDFYLNEAAPVIRTDRILITSQYWNTVNLIPTRSELEFVPSLHKFVATGIVVNQSNKLQKIELTAKFEIVNDCRAIYLDNSNRHELKKTLLISHLSREIIPTHYSAKLYLPVPSVCHVSLQSDHEFKISDTELGQPIRLKSDPCEEITLTDSDLTDTVHNKEPTYYGEAEIDSEIIDTSGIDLPTVIYKDAAEAIDLKEYSPELRPFIKDIFIDRYPHVVALHALDAGNLSLTLGFTQLRLREGEKLPRSKRIFHVSPTDQRHLDDLCEFLIKFGYIMRSPISPNGCHLYGMSAYLVPRAKTNCLGRLIIDYSPVNQLIQSPSSVIPEINATIQFLQGKALYTSLDLKYAYLSLRIDEESRKLTTFLTPTGSFQWLSLPTGAANSPAYFTDACNRMLHYEPVRDEKGDVIYESENVVKMERSILTHSCSYFDDIMITSLLKPTYHECLESHFTNVEDTVKRLAFHGAKISVMKCEFAKPKILFLGWYISHDMVIADPRRIQKVKEFKMPDNKKSLRAFLGLVNSLRRVLPINVINQMNLLTPLTSSKASYKLEPQHVKAFEQIKSLLTEQPLFAHLIREDAEKYLWVDASTTSGVLGAVLAQKVYGIKEEKIIPTCLNLDDEVHRIIFDKELPYEPTKLYTELPIQLPKPSALKTLSPNIQKPDKLLGFTEENVHESFFWSTISTLAVYGCQTPESTLELRQKAVKKLKSGILNNKLRDFTFNLNFHEYKNFLIDFTNGKVGLDPELFLAEALAQALFRPMIFISSLERHRERPIFTFNHTSEKPPLIYGIYSRQGKEIYLPFFHNKNVEFRLDHLKGKIEIIAYIAKTVPEALKSRPILDLEAFAILTALHSLQRFISGVKVTLLTDSRVLFYLFSSKVGNSCVKIRRWCLKLLSDYPQVTLHFVRTTENLADFLTREGLPVGDCEKLNLKDIQVSDFYDQLPKLDFTLVEWINFVEQHPEYLTINNQHGTANPKIKAVTLAISRGIENIKSTVKPLQLLQEKFEKPKLVECQKREFTKIYEACLASPNFQASVQDSNKQTHTYRLIADLLMIKIDFFKILVPPSLIGVLLSYTHLSGHKGLARMLAELNSYYFPNLNTITRNFIQGCYSCFLNNKGNRKSKIGVYPTPTYPFQEITMDLAENLNTINGYSHLLITQCVLTDFTVIVPLKSKQANETLRAFLNSLFQQFNIQRIHTDNGPCFRSDAWLEIMAALNIQVIASSALHPSGRGQVERLVKTVKTMLRKMLSTKPDLNWEYLPYLCSKIINTSISPKTGFTPQTMVFGNSDTNSSIFGPLQHDLIHPFVRNHKEIVESLHSEINKMVTEATAKLKEERLVTNERINKNRVEHNFKPNDYVFVLDRLNIPGNTRPLRSRFHPSPYIVIKPLWTTTLVKRLSDGYTTLYSNDDLKKYDAKSPHFSSLPVEISRVLLHDFQELIEPDFLEITKHDTLELSTSIMLFQDETHNEETENSNQSSTPITLQEPEDEILKDAKINLPADDLTPPPVNNNASTPLADAPKPASQELTVIDYDELAKDLNDLQHTTSLTDNITDELDKSSASESEESDSELEVPSLTDMPRRSKRVKFTV